MEKDFNSQISKSEESLEQVPGRILDGGIRSGDDISNFDLVDSSNSDSGKTIIDGLKGRSFLDYQKYKQGGGLLSYEDWVNSLDNPITDTLSGNSNSDGSFIPDTSQSAQQNADALLSWLANFLSSHGSSIVDISSPNLAFNYMNVMQTIAKSMKALFDSIGYEREENQGAIIDLIEKATNIVQSYTDNIFSMILAYQSWYLQQEYNTPLNQLKRLEQAGLSSAFYFGGFSNTAGSAPSIGGSGSLNSSGYMSGAGSDLQSDIISKRQSQVGLLQAAIAGAEATGNLISVGVNSSKTLAEANNVRLMTPLQMQNVVSDIQNKGVLRQFMTTQSDVMESTDFRNWVSTMQSVSKQGVDVAQQKYNSAISDDTAKSFGSYYVDEQTYTARVKTLDGKWHYQDFTRKELEDTFNAGGRTKSGDTVENSESWKYGMKLDITNSGSVSVPGFGKFGSDVSFGGNLDKSKSSSKSNFNENEISHSVGGRSLNDIGHYTDNGHGFQIGNTNFHVTTTKKRIDSEAYKAFMSEQRDNLIRASRQFNMLSDAEIGAWLKLYDSYNRNFSEGVKKQFLNSFLNSLQPSTNDEHILIGD